MTTRPVPRHRRKLGKEMARHWRLYLFLLIPVIYLVIFHYVPMSGIQIAFRKYTPRSGMYSGTWVGLENFRKFFASTQFGRVVPNTIILSLYSLVAGFPIPILLALALNSLRGNRVKRIIQSVTYIPHFISTVVMVGMLLQMLHTRTGLFAAAYTALTGNASVPDLVSSRAAFPHLYVWSGVWQEMGWSAIVYIAALTGVDPQLHEAAMIDGASRFKRLLAVDLPCLMPTIVIMLILRFGSAMSIGFEKIYLMQNNLNLQASEVISTYVYKIGLSASGGNFAYATAIDLFNSVINLALLAIVNLVARKLGDVSVW